VARTTLARRERIYSDLDPNVIAQIASLSRDTRWELLKEVYERRRRELSECLGRQQLVFSAQPVNQRRVDYTAGFWAGVQAILHAPDSAEKALERALSDQERINRLVSD